jgi:hypothetical protein
LFEKLRPGIKLRFLSQRMEKSGPEKKMPSTEVKVIRRSAKFVELIQVSAHWPLRYTAGTVSSALKE